jgi:PilZ domain-containing protein
MVVLALVAYRVDSAKPNEEPQTSSEDSPPSDVHDLEYPETTSTELCEITQSDPKQPSRTDLPLLNGVESPKLDELDPPEPPCLEPVESSEMEESAPKPVGLVFEPPASQPEPEGHNPSQTFLELWRRVPEFDNRLLALIANWQSGASPLERRRGVERLDCSIESICVSSEQRWESVIINLGVGGAELLHPDYVVLNTRLALVPKTHLIPVTGRVTWVLPQEIGYRVGLCFDSDPEHLSRSWVADTLLELGSAFLLKRAPRRYVRVATDVPSCLITDDGRQIEVVLKDVSLGGCLLQSSEPFDFEEITLRLGSVDCRGKVVNLRERPDDGWSHHVNFAPLSPLETLKLLRTISVLLKNGYK